MSTNPLLDELFCVVGVSLCGYISSTTDVSNLIESGLIHEDWKKKYPLSSRYQLYTNTNDLNNRILSLYKKYNIDFSESSIAKQTLNIWQFTKHKLNDKDIARITKNIDENVKEEFKDHLKDLLSDNNNETSTILIMMYLILYYLPQNKRVGTYSRYYRYGPLYGKKINYHSDDDNDHPFDKNHFNKLWKFDINTPDIEDIINYWISVYERCSLRYTVKDDTFEMRIHRDYRLTTWRLKGEYSDKFEADKYKNLKNTLEYDQITDGEYVKKKEKTKLKDGTIGNDIEKILLLPDFLEFEKWYYMDLESDLGCDCNGVYQKYRICIGQIKSNDENMNKFVVWQNKYCHGERTDDPECCCDF